MNNCLGDEMPIIDINNDKEVDKFYDKKILSFFNHWLSEREAADCDYFYYELAKEKGALKKFNNAKNKFLSFFYELFVVKNVFYIVEGIKTYPSKAEYDEIIELIIREKYRHAIFYPCLPLIIIPGFDLTHDLLIPKGDSWEDIFSLAKKHNLYIINT